MLFAWDLEAFELCLPASTLLLTKHFNIGENLNVLIARDDFGGRALPSDQRWQVKDGRWGPLSVTRTRRNWRSFSLA